jgi:hypothetical protein
MLAVPFLAGREEKVGLQADLSGAGGVAALMQVKESGLRLRLFDKKRP